MADELLYNQLLSFFCTHPLASAWQAMQLLGLPNDPYRTLQRLLSDRQLEAVNLAHLDYGRKMVYFPSTEGMKYAAKLQAQRRAAFARAMHLTSHRVNRLYQSSHGMYIARSFLASVRQLEPTRQWRLLAEEVVVNKNFYFGGNEWRPLSFDGIGHLMLPDTRHFTFGLLVDRTLYSVNSLSKRQPYSVWLTTYMRSYDYMGVDLRHGRGDFTALFIIAANDQRKQEINQLWHQVAVATRTDRRLKQIPAFIAVLQDVEAVHFPHERRGTPIPESHLAAPSPQVAKVQPLSVWARLTGPGPTELVDLFQGIPGVDARVPIPVVWEVR